MMVIMVFCGLSHALKPQRNYPCCYFTLYSRGVPPPSLTFERRRLQYALPDRLQAGTARPSGFHLKAHKHLSILPD